MKKALLMAVVAISATAFTAGAQRAAEYDLGTTGKTASYNRIGISYNNTQLMPNDNYKKDGDIDKNISLNGFGVDYIHGFSLSSTLPMFIETGLNANFNFGEPTVYEYRDEKYKAKIQNINLQVPVNFAYKFYVGDDFSIAPYAGLNLKLHLLQRYKEVYEYDGEKEESDKWTDMFSKDDMGEDGTWNRFQMGWQVGVGFQYSKFYLGVQYGTDFIPAYSEKDDGEKYSVNSGNLKVSLAYSF